MRKRVVVQFLYESSLIQKDRPIVHLSTAPLEGIDLRRATLRNINLAGAQLSDGDLSDADLSKAFLSGASLQNATLSDASGITSEELEQQVMTLEGATMPNGQKYEEWLKSEGRAGEDGENTSSP